VALRTRSDPETQGLESRSLTEDLAPWQVERDALLLADGSYVLGFRCEPLATDWMSPEDLETVARRAQAFLHAMPEGEDLRIVYEVASDPGGAIRDHAERTEGVTGPLRTWRDLRVRARVREQRLGETLRARLLILLSYHPPRLRPPNRWAVSTITAGLLGILASALVGWRWGLPLAAVVWTAMFLLMPRRPGKFAPRLRGDVERDHQVLRGMRAVAMAHLGALGLEPRPLSPQEYLEAVWRYLNPRQAAGGVTPPEVPGDLYELSRTEAEAAPWALPVSFRQVAARSGLDRDWSHLKIDDRYVKVLAMDTLPVGATVMLHLLPALAMREPLTCVLDIHKPRTHQMVQRLIARSSLAGNVAESAASEAATTGAARQHESLQRILWRVFGGETQVVRVGLGIVVARRSLEVLDRTALELFRLAGEMRAVTLVDETLALAPQFRRLMPGSGQTNRRMRIAVAENAVHLMPISGPWRGSPRAEAIFPNRWGGLTAIDLFDSRVAGWNGVVAGKTGTGKSAFVCQLLIQLLRPTVRAIIIDKGQNVPPGSYLTLTRALGGAEVRFDVGGGTSINPFDIAPEQLRYFLGEETSPDDAQHAAQKHTFLVTLVDRLTSPRGGTGLSLDEQALVGEAISQTYRRQHLRGEPVFLHDLVATLRNPGDVGSQALSQEQQRTLDSIATRLWQWCERGRYAQLLDRPTNVSLDAPLTYIDIGPITGQADLMPVVVLLLQDLIYRQALRNVGRERLIVVQDELWSVLADPVAARFLDDMYRRFRHVGAAVLSVSQDMRDFQSPEARAILGNATWWFLLPVTDPDSTIEIAGLNPNQARLLRRLTNRPGEHAEILAVARLGDHTESGVLVAKPTSPEFWVAASNPDERALRERYIREAGGDVLAGLERLAREHPRGCDALDGRGTV
jgi:conjugal transfer ATP-binding protein TraC